MDQQQAQSSKPFWQNDRKLVCSMLVVYGLCIVGLVGTTIFGLDRRSKRLSANATSTALAVATGHANATATAVARATEQAQYSLINRFDINNYSWRQGTEDNEYWSGYTAFENGVYVWEVKEAKGAFISWADFPGNDDIRDFDVYVDTKVVKGEPSAVCSGLLFRKSPEDSQKGGYYYFSLCHGGTAEIRYYSNKDGWENIAAVPYYHFLFRPHGEWDRLELSARGSHFLFSINGDKIYEMEDDRQEVGGIALVIELTEKAPARIVFDNFGLQYR